MIKYIVEVYDDNSVYWYKNGKLHRKDDPAIERANGDKEWYLNGKHYREEYHKEIQKRSNPVKELTVAEISEILGYDVKIVK